MSQLRSDTQAQEGVPLPRIVGDALTPEQRELALQRIQAQSDKRTRLGFELFRAAEAQTTRQQATLDLLQTEQEVLSNRLDNEVAEIRRELQQHQTALNNQLAKTTEALELKIEALQHNWSAVEVRIVELIKRIGPLAQKPKRQVPRPAPRPRIDTPAPDDHPVIADVPTTAASMPSVREDAPAPVSTNKTPPTQDTTMEQVYSQALQHLRSTRAQPADY